MSINWRAEDRHAKEKVKKYLSPEEKAILKKYNSKESFFETLNKFRQSKI